MSDPRLKPYVMTLEIEGFSVDSIVKRLEKLIEDERTISFDVREKEED